MRLLETLTRKRDHHLAMAAKFSELIAVLEGDVELVAIGHRAQRKIVNGVKAHVAGLGAPAVVVDVTKFGAPGAELTPARKAWSAAARKKQAQIMRARWKDPKIRRRLLKGLGKSKRAATAAAK